MNNHWTAPGHRRFLREAARKFAAGGTYNRRPGRGVRTRMKVQLRQLAREWGWYD